MRTNHNKLKTCVAVLTAVTCMATSLAGISASAVNYATSGTDKALTADATLSKGVYVFKDTDMNIVLPYMAFENTLTKYSYEDTNVKNNKTSIGFSVIATADFSKYSAKVTNRVICDAILGEMYEAGYTTVYAEVHGGSDVGGMLIPIRITKSGSSYTPVADLFTYAIPVDLSMVTSSTKKNEFYRVFDADGNSLTGYFTSSSDCMATMYNGQPITYVPSDTGLMMTVDDIRDASGATGAYMEIYRLNNNGDALSSSGRTKFSVVYSAPKFEGLYFQNKETENIDYVVKGGYAAAVNLNDETDYDIYYMFKKQIVESAAGGSSVGTHFNAGYGTDSLENSGFYVAGFTSNGQPYGYFMLPNDQYNRDHIGKFIKSYGFSEYYADLGLTSPVTDEQTEYSSVLDTSDISKLADSETGTVDVDKNFSSITDQLKDRDATGSFDTSTEKNGTYDTGLQDLYTAKGDYKYPINSSVGEDGKLIADAASQYDAEAVQKMFGDSSSDYYVEFLNGKLAFVSHDADYALTAPEGVQDIREVSTEYLNGSGSYNVQSEELRDCKEDAPAVKVSTEADSTKKLFLPDCTYELTNGTDLVRIRLNTFKEMYPSYVEDGNTTDGNIYIYDSKYSSPADAYAAGAACYAVKEGKYDVLLPAGNYRLTYLAEEDDGDGDVVEHPVNVGEITDGYRDVDMDDLKKGTVTDIVLDVTAENSVVDLTYGKAMNTVDVAKYVKNSGKVGGIKSVTLAEGNENVKGIELKDTKLNGTPLESGEKKVTYTVTAGNGTTADLLLTFRIAKGTVKNVEVTVEDKNYEAGDDLPDLILGKDTPSGKVSWVVDEVKKLTEGDNTLTWEYTPDDDNYDKVTGTLVINASAKQTTTTTVTTTDTTEGSTSDSATGTTVSTDNSNPSTTDGDSTVTTVSTDLTTDTNNGSGTGSSDSGAGSETTTATGNSSDTTDSGNGSGTTTVSATTGNGNSSGTTTTTGTGVPKDTLYGDLNLDGKVDLSDAVMLNKAVIGSISLSGQSAINANTCSDSKIDANDATALLQFLVRYITTLPVTK